MPAFFRLSPDNFTDQMWGGQWIPKLKGLAGKRKGPVGESWEFSVYPGRPTHVLLDGRPTPLPNFLLTAPEKIIGEKLAKELGGTIPFLVKLIDAEDDLSVQIHPDDVYAKKHERESGKAESWIVLDSDSGREQGDIYLGFNPVHAGSLSGGPLKKKFREALEKANALGASREPAVRSQASSFILPFLNKIHVHPGEVYNLSPGTVHAVGAGVRLFEIQQSSDLTYRVWD